MLKISRHVGDGIVAGDLLIQIIGVETDAVSFGFGNADDEIAFPPTASVVASAENVRVGDWLNVDSIALKMRAYRVLGNKVKLEVELPSNVRFHRKEIYDHFQSIPWQYETIVCKAGERFVWGNTRFHIESVNSAKVRLNGRSRDNEDKSKKKQYPRVDDAKYEALERSIEEKLPNAFDLGVGESGSFRNPLGSIKCLELATHEAKLEFEIHPEFPLRTLAEVDKEKASMRKSRLTVVDAYPSR